MKTEVLAKEAWNFVVFGYGADWVLTYVAGGVGLYEVSIRLTPEELAHIVPRPSSPSLWRNSSAALLKLTVRGSCVLQ